MTPTLGRRRPGPHQARRRRPRLQILIAQHDLPSAGARDTAVIDAVSGLPPVVASDLFGVTASSTYR